MLNDFTVEPLKTSFAQWRDICYRLRHMCWTFSVNYNMYLSIYVFYLWLFCYLFIMLSKWDNTFRKLMGMLF